MKPPAERFVTAVFCDDIRHEVGNKMSLMGCYQGEMFVASAPALLPKFCIFATATTPKDRPFKSLTFKVLVDDTIELAKFEVPTEGLAGNADPLDENSTRKAVSTAMMFSPFSVEKATVLRVNVVTEEGETVGPRLQIKIGQEVAVSALAPAKKATPKAAAKKALAKARNRSSS